LKSDFKIILSNWSPYWDDLLRATFGSLYWRSRSQHDLSTKLFTAHNFVFEVDLKTISHEWSPYWDDVSSVIFRLLPWRSRSQQDLTAKSCPAHNFVILQFFYINDHLIETTCRTLHLGRFLKVKVTAWPFSIIVSGP